jgi:hypothetical protein
MVKNKCCYTALFSDYEDLKTPAVVPEDWDFICFTDQPLKSDVWKIIQIKPDLPSQRMARMVKLLPHVFLPEYEYTFWLDASFQINVNLNDLWNRWFKPPFCCPAHPIRNCVYREIQSCIVNKRGDEAQLEHQRNEYKKLKVPEFGGIITSGVLMRQKTVGCMKMCDEWWEELSKYSARDQVAFANISRGWKFNTFIWDYSQSKELKYFKHYNKRH